MLQNKGIICVAFPSWEGDYIKPSVEVMRVLGTQNKVLYVNYQHTLKDVLWAILGKNERSVRQLLGLQRRVRKVENTNVHVLTPIPSLPINWLPNNAFYRLGLKINAFILAISIKKASKEIELDDPVMVNAFNPFSGLPLVKYFNKLKHVYFCYDDIASAPWAKKHGPQLEKEFIQKCGAVITTSSKLHSTKSKEHPNCYLMKNGVNYDLFQKGYSKEKKGQPNIGYIGSIDDRLDRTVLQKSFIHYPDYKFSFVGRAVCKDTAEWLKSFKNVTVYGALNPQDLSQMLRSFHIGIIPFVHNQFTSNIYPLKINEYLSAGLPVVATDFSDLSDFSEIISICSSNEEFVTCIKKELGNIGLKEDSARQKMAKSNSWNSRVENEFTTAVNTIVTPSP